MEIKEFTLEVSGVFEASEWVDPDELAMRVSYALLGVFGENLADVNVKIEKAGEDNAAPTE